MRRTGFYWVRLKRGQWMVAYWYKYGNYWSVVHSRAAWKDSDFWELGKRRLTTTINGKENG